MRRATSILLAILFLTAAYVYTWPTASVPYFAGVILHLAAGVALVITLAFTLNKTLRGAPSAAQIGWILIAFGGTLGVVLIFTGTRRTEWPLLYIHIAACAAGGAFLAADWIAQHRAIRSDRLTPLPQCVRCVFFSSLLLRFS